MGDVFHDLIHFHFLNLSLQYGVYTLIFYFSIGFCQQLCHVV